MEQHDKGDIRIVSDGTTEGTYILMGNQPIAGIKSVNWSFNKRTNAATVTMEMDNPHRNGNTPLTQKGNEALQAVFDELS